MRIDPRDDVAARGADADVHRRRHDARGIAQDTQALAVAAQHLAGIVVGVAIDDDDLQALGRDNPAPTPSRCTAEMCAASLRIGMTTDTIGSGALTAAPRHRAAPSRRPCAPSRTFPRGPVPPPRRPPYGRVLQQVGAMPHESRPASFGGTTKPSTPARTNSRVPPTSVAITGTPLAIASSTTFGMPSQREVSQNSDAARRIVSTSPRSPVNVTRSGNAQLLAWRFSAARNGPSPTITKRCAGNLAPVQPPRARTARDSSAPPVAPS